MNVFELMTMYPEVAPFIQHGFAPEKVVSGTQMNGDCVFCGKPLKMFVNKLTHNWDCKVCGKKGGFQTFLKEMADHCKKVLTEAHIVKLTKSRGIAKETFVRHGIGYNEAVGAYSIPVYGMSGKDLVDLRMYQNGRLIGTKTCKTGLWNVQNLPTSSGTVWLCEGEWDGLAMSEILFKAGLITDVAVAVPGAGTFKPYWIPSFKGRDIKVLYDHDKAGREGAVRVYNSLSAVAKSLTFLMWEPEEDDGYDIRDLYNRNGNDADKVLKYINGRLVKEPVGAKTGETKSQMKEQINPLEELTGAGCDAQEVYDVFQKHLHLPDTDVVDVICGTIIANRLEGDPVWLFLVAPSGMCKTELLQSFSTAKRVMATSTLTPHALVSGFSIAGGGDPSLIPALNEKTLIIKDFTTIFNMNIQAREEIFGILRDAYDGEITKRFANGIVREYKSRFGILAGVTPVVESFLEGESALGERFLRYELYLPDTLDTLMPYLQRASGNIANEDGMRAAFRETCNRCLDHAFENNVEIPVDMVNKVLYLAMYGSLLRGVVMRDKYTREVLGRQYIEMGTRFSKELLKLMRGICMFKGKTVADGDEYRIVCHAVRSTVSKQNFYMQLIYDNFGVEKFALKDLHGKVNLPMGTIQRVVETLSLLNLLQRCGEGVSVAYRISDDTMNLITTSEIYQ